MVSLHGKPAGMASPYHDTKVSPKDKPAELDIAVLSPPLKPHGILRATHRRSDVASRRPAVALAARHAAVQP